MTCTINPSKDVHVIVPQTPVNMLQETKEVSGVIKVKDLEMGEYAGIPGWVNPNQLFQ